MSIAPPAPSERLPQPRHRRGERVLVVGTTPDYVEMLEREHPGRCLFITDPGLRAAATEPPPGVVAELVVPCGETDLVHGRLTEHLRRHALQLVGVACFDCESMALAADLAERLGLDYPSARSIATVRNKHATTRRWRRAGLPCPRSALARSESELVAFRGEIDGPVVLKPLSGSGSELVFSCRDDTECRAAFRLLTSRLAVHLGTRMYAPLRSDEGTVDPRRVFAAEELVEGVELSCDFVVDRGSVRIIRVCRKVGRVGEPLGTVHAYVIPAELPEGVSFAGLEIQLGEAAAALGIERALCVVDMVVRNGALVMIELAPRPAGDCLPALIRASSGLDILGFALDFACGASSPIPDPDVSQTLVAVRFLAATAGRLTRLDDAALRADPRVVQVHLARHAGDVVAVPPESYDLRLLGHAIFRPAGAASIEDQCDELLGRLIVQIDPPAAGAGIDASRPTLITAART